LIGLSNYKQIKGIMIIVTVAMATAVATATTAATIIITIKPCPQLSSIQAIMSTNVAQ